MTIAIILDHVEKGWIASALEIRASAQGDSRDEAMGNLLALIRTYPELLDDLNKDERPSERNVELVAV